MFEGVNTPKVEKESSPEELADIGIIERGPETSTQFEGSEIYLADKDGVPVRYAIRRNSNGELEGSIFLMQEKKLNGVPESEVEWVDSKSVMDYIEPENPNSPDHRIPWEQQLSQGEMEAVLKQLEGKNISGLV